MRLEPRRHVDVGAQVGGVDLEFGPDGSLHFGDSGFGLRVFVGMLPLILTVLSRDYNTPPIIIPTKDCWYKGEHPMVQGFRASGLGWLPAGSRFLWS